jgi:glutamine synthetase adenylyltransferase
MPDGVETDEVADRARIVGKEQAFRIGVRVLSETAGAAETGLAFSQLAGLLLGRLHQAVLIPVGMALNEAAHRSQERLRHLSPQAHQPRFFCQLWPQCHPCSAL